MTAAGTLRRAYWSARYASWGRRPAPPFPGYTLLVPVPGDLPVFTRIALAVCRLQDPTHRLETLVVPDVDSPVVGAVVAEAARDWPGGGLRLVRLRPVERVVLPRLGNPGKNHGAQIIAAVRESETTHIVLHDADLFMLADDVHEAEYRTAIDRHAAAVGVDASWDDWYREHGLSLVATWEMCADVAWLRHFPPSRLFGHDAELFGEQHTFDTTFWAQCHTEPAALLVRPRPADVIHFNYVISTYRRFQRSDQRAFADTQLRLLLIRTFIDLFDPDGAGYEVPSRADLVRGLTDAAAPVTYSSVDPATYRAFRARLAGILDGAWVAPQRRATAAGYLDAFDAHFG